MLLSNRKLAEDLSAGRILPEGSWMLSGDRMRKTEFIRCKRDVGTMRTRTADRYAVSTGLCAALLRPDRARLRPKPPAGESALSAAMDPAAWSPWQNAGL